MLKKYQQYIHDGVAILPEGMDSIETGAFEGCRDLTSILIPKSAKRINKKAFSSCTSLSSVVIPKGIKIIGESAFSECWSLTTIVIPKGVKKIGKHAFSGCMKLSSIDIPNTIYEIGDYAFESSGLTSIMIPPGVSIIGDGAFSGCYQLTSIDIPSSVYTIGPNAFSCSLNLLLGNKSQEKHFGRIERMRVRIKDPSSTRFLLSHCGLNYSNVTLYVPNGTVSAYRQDDFFMRFKGIASASKWLSEGPENKTTTDYSTNEQPCFNKEKFQRKHGKAKYVFFDTETTGLPKDYKAPSSALNNWPRMIQLSWIATDKDGTIIAENDHIIYPNGFVIPFEASKVNGISSEVAKKKGDPIDDVIRSFMEDVEAAEYIVGHNVSFDIHVVGAELIRLGKKDTLATKPGICTMQSTIDYCAIPGNYGYKYPKLQELHKKLFGYEFKDAHNALTDIRATLQCFLELKRRHIIDD